MKILENFSKVSVLIVGDVMLDRYWWGTTSRISPEAPVPVVNINKTSLVAGGAANVAANVAGLGAKPYLIGVIGKDEEAKYFPKVLRDVNVESDYLVRLNSRRSTVKTRIIAHNQHVVRIDQENSEQISKPEVKKVISKIESVFDKTDIIIISDYAKGTLTDELITWLIETAIKKKKKVLVDPKGKNYSKYSGATLLTPNQKEAAEACNLEDNGLDVVGRSGKMLLENLMLENLLITQGENGMVLFQKNKDTRHLKALARTIYDVTGAGDTVIAGLAVALASGANFYEAAEIANISAGLVVEQIGTTAISFGMLQDALL